MRAIPGLGEEKLNEICADFCSLGYPAGEKEIQLKPTAYHDTEYFLETLFRLHSASHRESGANRS